MRDEIGHGGVAGGVLLLSPCVGVPTGSRSQLAAAAREGRPNQHWLEESEHGAFCIKAYRAAPLCRIGGKREGLAEEEEWRRDGRRRKNGPFPLLLSPPPKKKKKEL